MFITGSRRKPGERPCCTRRRSYLWGLASYTDRGSNPFRSTVLSSRSLVLILVLAWAPLACVTPRAGDRPVAPAPVLSPWEKIPISDGRGVIRRMRARYDGQFLTSLTFRQLNTLYPVSGGEQKSEWMEYAIVPGRLRIEYLPSENRSGVIVNNHRIHAFDKGRATRNDRYIHPLMVLLYDVHALPADSTLVLADSLRFNLSLVREDTWQGRRTYVIGAVPGDSTANQFWVDAERLVTVRVIQTEKRGTRSVLSDTRMDQFVEFDGVPIATEILFLRDGRPYFRELYTEVKANAELSSDLFDPAKWTETGGFRRP